MGDTIRVLHVDDDPEFADLTATCLEREDDRFAVETATSASEGLDRLVSNDFGCVVSDYDMPGQNGIEFLEAVREDHADLPFILYTGKGSEEIASSAISAGVTDYLQKESGTGQYAVLANRINNAVERREVERERARQLDAIETAQEGISILNDDGHYIYVNQRFADLHGYDPEEMIGEHWELVYRDEDVPEVREEILPTVEQAGYWHGETTSLRSDGSTVVVDHTLATTEQDELVCTVRDISKRKERERELAEYETIVEAVSDPIYVLDEKGRFTYVNDEFVELVGYEKETILGTTPSLIKDETAVQTAERHLGRLLSSEGPEDVTFEVPIHPREGEPVVCEDHMGVLPYEGEQFNGSVGTLRDISEQKQREQELTRRTTELEELTTELEEQYRHLFEEAPVMAVVTRAENGKPIIEDCNNLFVETLGYGKEELIGTNLADLYTPESRERLLGGGYERALAGEFVREERGLVTSNGETVETLLRAVPRQDTDEETRGTLALYINISERKELQREKERLEEFTSIVSHDLRNPLNVAQSRAELACEESDSEHLSDVLDAHNQMEELIEDLLTYARSGDSVEDVAPVDLARLSEECWEGIGTDEATLQTSVSHLVRADRNRLRQLLGNLIRNAIEHGGADVTVTVGDWADGFYVEDDGPGIPEEANRQVFQAGYSSSSDGTGFGLSIVKQIVEAHGWDIRLTSGSDGGARFEITDVEFVNQST